MKRTRAIDILERARIPYELREFAAVEFTVEETSTQLALPLGVLFKTLVAEGERRGMVMALVPGG